MVIYYWRALRTAITVGMVLATVSGLAGTAAGFRVVEQSQSAGTFRSITQGAHVPSIIFLSTELDAFNQLTGQNIGIVAEYYPWSMNFDDSHCGYFHLLFSHDQVSRCGDQPPGPEIHTVPMLTWMPLANPPSFPSCNVWDGSHTNLDAIINGSCDGYVDDFATRLKNWSQKYGDTFMIRFAHEMNITDSPWWRDDPNYPAKYAEAFRHVHQRFNLMGATNQYAQFVWSPNYRSNPWKEWNSISNYYPGDAYVDWIGLSGYNFSTYRPGSHWWTFSDIYDDPSQADPWQTNDGVKVGVVRFLMCHYAKPIVITEIGTVPGPDEGTGGTRTKANWIADTYSKIQDFPYIRAITWFNDYYYHNPSDVDFRVTGGSSYDPNLEHYPGYQSALSNWTQAYKTAIASSPYTSTLPPLASLMPSRTYCGPAPALDAPAAMLARPGDTVRATVGLQDITTTVTLSVTGLLSGYNSSFDPAATGPFAHLPDNETSLMTINVPGDALVGDTPLMVHAAGADLSLSDPTTLMVRDQLYFVYLPRISRP